MAVDGGLAVTWSPAGPTKEKDAAEGRIRVDGERSMTKSELIELIAAKQSHLPAKDVELAVKQILEIMSDALAQGQRIEIRGLSLIHI